MNLPPDFKDLLAAFARAGVEFALVGGWAVAFHGRVRATKDIDLLLAGDAENLGRAARAAEDFGAPPNVVVALGSLKEDEVAFFGRPPRRVDFLRTIDGVSTPEVMARAIRTRLDGVELRIISRADLIANKRAAGRPRDLEDADYLERLGPL